MSRASSQMKVNEIKQAISKLPQSQKSRLIRWLAEMEEEEWDERIRKDAGGGKLKDILEEVDADIESGRLLRGP